MSYLACFSILKMKAINFPEIFGGHQKNLPFIVAAERP
jgi:hypothetical protein